MASLLQHKILAIKKQVENEKFLKSKDLIFIADQLSQKYFDIFFGEETPSEKLLRLKKEDDLIEYQDLWEFAPKAKEIWDRKDYDEVVPKLVIYWNKKLFENEFAINNTYEQKELPSGALKFYPDQIFAQESLTNNPGDFLKMLYGDLNYTENEEVEWQNRDVIILPSPTSHEIFTVEDGYISFASFSKIGSSMANRLLPHLYKKIDTDFNDKIISQEELEQISKAKEYIKVRESFLKAANIDNLRLGAATKRAAEVSIHTKDVSYSVFTEIVFAGKRIAVPDVLLYRAMNLAAHNANPVCEIYYDESEQKLIVTAQDSFSIINTGYGKADLWDTVNLEAFAKGITARQVEKIEAVSIVEHFTPPSELLERKPKLREIIERQKELVPKFQQGGMPKRNAYEEIVTLAHEYVASYTKIVTERGVELRKAVIPQHKLNTLSYVYEVDDIFWEYNPDIDLEELLAFFVSKGKNEHYQTLCLKILGIDYMLNYNIIVDNLIEKRLLMIDNIKIDYVTKKILDLKYEYLHFYASGNIYAKKKQLEKIQTDLLEYYGNDQGMRIIAAQNEILDERTPPSCSVISAEKDKQLELDINHEMFFADDFPKIATRSSVGVKNIRPLFFDYYRKIPKLGGITDSEIDDGYFEPKDKSSFIKKYIVKKWKHKGRVYDLEGASAIGIGNSLFNKSYKKMSDFEKDEQLEIKEVHRAVIAAYHERITRVKNEGNRIFNLFLKSEVSNSFQQLISQTWNEKYNNYSAPVLTAVPTFFRIARYFGQDNKLFRLKKVQVNGVRFFIGRDNSALLAHEVGYGKTTSSLAIMSHLIEVGEASRLLVLTPKRVYDKFLREGRGEGNFRGCIPHINFIELENAKPDVFLPVVNNKGDVIKWKLKEYSKDELKAITDYKLAVTEINRKVENFQNRRLEADAASVDLIEQTIAKYVPGYTKYYFLDSMVKNIGYDKDNTLRKIKDEVDALIEKQGTASAKEEEKIAIFHSKKFSKEALDRLDAMKKIMVDEMGTFFPEVYKPKSIILATHVAIEELRPSREGIEEAIKAVDDVVEINDARDKTKDWLRILDNNSISLERLKIDGIVVDEIHNFNELVNLVRPRYYVKKRDKRGDDTLTYSRLPLGSRDAIGRHTLRYYYSIPPTNKDKINLLSIVLGIAAKQPKQNSLMLSATPFTEGPIHMFSVMNLVNRRRLKSLNMDSAYNFFMNFIWEAWKFDVTIDGRKGLFATVDKYRNNIGLCNFMAAFSDFKITDEEIEKLRPVKYIIPDDENRIGGITSYVPLTDVQKIIKHSIGEFIAGRIKEEEICRVSREIEIGEIDEDASEFDAEELVASGNLRKEEMVSARIFKAKSMQEKMVISPYLMGCLPKGVNLPPLDDVVRDKMGEPMLWEGREIPADAKHFVENSPKILYAVECIRSVLQKHELDGTAPSGQIIYLNMGKSFVYQNIRYNAYELIAKYLTNPVYRPDIGLQPEDIGVIHGGIHDESLISEVQRKFNNGQIKVLLGSASIREGIDLQQNSTAMYIVNAEYNPTNAMQLEGRIWRQGNKWKNVRVVYILAYDSIDVFIYSKLKNKINSVREIMRAGKCDLNETQVFSLDPGEVQINLTTNVDDLADLSWQNEERKLRHELERRNSEINLLRLIHKGYPKIKSEYDTLLGRLNTLSQVLEDVKYNDLKESVMSKIRSAEREKVLEAGQVALTPDEIEKQAEELIANGTYKKIYEHVDFKEDMAYTLFQQRLDVLRSNYKIARQWEGRKLLHEKEIEELTKQIPQAEKYKEEKEKDIQDNPYVPADLTDLGKTDPRLKSLAEAIRHIEKWKTDLERALTEKTKQQTYWESIISVGYSNFEDYEKSVNRFTSGSDNDTVLNSYNSQVTAAGMKFSDVEDIIETQQKEIGKISGRINNRAAEIQKLVAKFTKLLEERKKQGKFSIYDQIAAYDTTNYLIQ